MTHPVNSALRKARSIQLAAVGATLVAVAAVAPPASAATGGARLPAPVTAAVGDRYPVDEAELAKLMAPGSEANGTMVRVAGPGTRWVKAVGAVSQNPAASFRIGSMTKMFTSTVVLQLVAEGRLDLDTPIAEVLPELVPAAWHPITVGQLLSHTSGLGKPCGELKDGTGLTPERVVAAWTKAGCPAPEYPVTRQQYNGGNYFLLGLAIEKVTGRSYADEVQRRIARSLGLHHTYVPRSGDSSMPVPSLAAPTPQEPWAWAEGGMISTGPDMERFMKALLGGRLLPPAQQALLTEMPELARTAKRPFSAAGLMTARLSDGTRVWGKTGSMAQYTSGAFATADGRRVVTYSYLPTPELTSDQAVARAVAIIEAAL
ncbi:serine hydrolase domain-containing protein [Streptomyces sp. NPDC001594]|uniref:serine hydrolase domain-containing protein n=1 Tax=Streptomyces sp. NPDC001594 TaxID=3364590 RepID=UPI0036AE08B4